MKQSDNKEFNSRTDPFVLDFEATLRKHNLLNPGRHILLAVSGGLDSMVMLHAFLAIQKKYRLKLSVAHVNHNLRGRESDADEMFVFNSARDCRLPCYSVKLNIKALAAESGCSLEEAGRLSRFEFFEKLAARLSCDFIALAHHADDRAETILMHLARGSGLRGLSGIRMIRDKIIHPLLTMTRRQLENRARQCALAYRVDSSNFERNYLRNQIRWDVLKPLKEIYGNSVVESICRSGDLILETESTIQKEVETALRRGVLIQKKHEFILDIPIFLGYFTAIQKGVLMHVIRSLDPAHIFTEYHSVERCLRLVRTGRKNARILLNHTFEALHSGEKIVFRQMKPVASCSRSIVVGTCTELPEFYGKLCIHRYHGDLKFNGDPNCEFIDGTRLGKSLTVRTWRPGDRFIPLGMEKSKKLHDFFIDIKMPGYLRKRVPILENGHEIVWLAGCRISNQYRLKPSSRNIVQLQWRPE